MSVDAWVFMLEGHLHVLLPSNFRRLRSMLRVMVSAEPNAGLGRIVHGFGRVQTEATKHKILFLCTTLTFLSLGFGIKYGK